MLKEKLKTLRKKSNKTQREMAKLLNISQNAYCKYELGTTEPNIQTINQLANIFNVDANYLISDFNSNDNLSMYTKNELEIIQIMKQLNNIELIKTKAYMQGLIDNRLNKIDQQNAFKDTTNE